MAYTTHTVRVPQKAEGSRAQQGTHSGKAPTGTTLVHAHAATQASAWQGTARQGAASHAVGFSAAAAKQHLLSPCACQLPTQPQCRSHPHVARAAAVAAEHEHASAMSDCSGLETRSGTHATNGQAELAPCPHPSKQTYCWSAQILLARNVHDPSVWRVSLYAKEPAAGAGAAARCLPSSPVW
jgi:hypothetical protein